MRLKTKLSVGMGTLFFMILVCGIFSIIAINMLKNDAQLIIQDNHESLLYSNNMLKLLDALETSEKTGWDSFAHNLALQEANITERGEREATQQIRAGFDQYRLKGNQQEKKQIMEGLLQINDLNQRAIFQKNEKAKSNARTATTLFSIILTLSILVALTLVVNFPGIVSNPVKALSEGITAIAHRDYRKRIYLDQKDEFGELANAFNTMAERLDEWESSNVAQIKFEKSRIETIIAQMQDAIIGLDEKGAILFMNGIAERLTGLKEKAVVGKYAPDVALKNDLLRALLQDRDNKELKIYADEKESYFIKEHFEVRNNELIIGQVIVLRNVTPFHELNEAKTNFIATVSHELKTPISSIKMSAALLNNEQVGKLNAEQGDLVKGIIDDAGRLLKITGELLNMTQVETGHIQLRIQPVQPGPVLTEALQAVQAQAQQAGISLDVNVEENLSDIEMDREKTSWVLINLLTNAIKYSYEQGTVSIRIARQGDRIFFSVTDRGRGIDARYLPRVFDRYYKVPGSSDKAGTGLGLSISKEFIEAQQGSMVAESRPGEGSTFGFYLPVNS